MSRARLGSSRQRGAHPATGCGPAGAGGRLAGPAGYQCGRVSLQSRRERGHVRVLGLKEPAAPKVLHLGSPPFAFAAFQLRHSQALSSRVGSDEFLKTVDAIDVPVSLDVWLNGGVATTSSSNTKIAPIQSSRHLASRDPTSPSFGRTQSANRRIASSASGARPAII